MVLLVAFGPLATACVVGRERLADERASPRDAQEVHEEEPAPRGFDSLHAHLTQGIRRASAWIDRFLSDERSTEEENRSWAAVVADSSLEVRRGFDAGARLRLHVVLPRTQEKLALAFEGEGEPADELREDPLSAGTAAAPENPDLSLRYLLQQTQRKHMRLEGGVRFDDLDPDPYAGIRWRYAVAVEPWLFRATERYRVYSDSGAESRTALDLERLLAPASFFRTTARALWREEEDFEYGLQFLLRQEAGEDRLRGLELDATVVTEPVHLLDKVALRLRLSQRFYERKLLVEIAPQIEWREEFDYVPAPGLLVEAELSFGRY